MTRRGRRLTLPTSVEEELRVWVGGFVDEPDVVGVFKGVNGFVLMIESYREGLFKGSAR